MKWVVVLVVMVVVVIVMVVIDVMMKLMIVAGEPQGIWMQYFPLNSSREGGGGGPCRV